MVQGNFKLKLLFALVCCFAIIAIPVAASAQGGIIDGAKHGVQKGADVTKKGVVTGAEKTKEGAEAVGHGVKNVFTDDDNKTDQTTTQEQRMKSTTKPGSSTSTEKGTTM